jgi:hypothetical protein
MTTGGDDGVPGDEDDWLRSLRHGGEPALLRLWEPATNSTSGSGAVRSIVVDPWAGLSTPPSLSSETLSPSSGL